MATRSKDLLDNNCALSFNENPRLVVVHLLHSARYNVILHETTTALSFNLSSLVSVFEFSRVVYAVRLSRASADEVEGKAWARMGKIVNYIHRSRVSVCTLGKYETILIEHQLWLIYELSRCAPLACAEPGRPKVKQNTVHTLPEWAFEIVCPTTNGNFVQTYIS